MNHIVALFSSVASLTLISLIYVCRFRTRQSSWLQSEYIGMNLMALLVGLYTLAVPATLLGLWRLIADGLSLSTLMNSAIDLASIAAIIATTALFLRAARRANREGTTPNNVFPLTPSPSAPRTPPKGMKKAA
ncbi:hypothetical protein HJ526_09135 [Donghicola sp. C2-DW-16]|uniref:Uncharacterized protein n=1 Tax=Donghicola mangrovi TaxID=2729614 RepID=A0ABX2PDN4_9RHOB|nr:hypothetical protein [Donghicola mangrovi]NVO27581.1 hypothetical protein [Donghicola mangrovi]